MPRAAVGRAAAFVLCYQGGQYDVTATYLDNDPIGCVRLSKCFSGGDVMLRITARPALPKPELI